MSAPITASRLAEEMDVSLRSLYRDIDSLRAAAVHWSSVAIMSLLMIILSYVLNVRQKEIEAFARVGQGGCSRHTCSLIGSGWGAHYASGPLGNGLSCGHESLTDITNFRDHHLDACLVENDPRHIRN